MRLSLFALLICLATPAFSQSGFLQVHVFEEGIEITVESRGSVLASPAKPVEFGLKPGSYTITAKKAGFEDLVKTARIEADKITEVNISIFTARPRERQLPFNPGEGLSARTGDLKIISVPADRAVFIDGEQRQFNTPMEITGMQTGYYTIRTAGCDVVAPVREDAVTLVECMNSISRVTFSDAGRRTPQPTDVARQNRFGGDYDSERSFWDQRFEIGLGGGSMTVREEGTTKSGVGINTSLAYAINRRVTLGAFGSYGIIPVDGSPDNSKNLLAGVFGRLYITSSRSSFRPFIVLGGGGAWFDATAFGLNVEASGVAGMAGLGFDYALSNSMALYLQAEYNNVNYDTATVGNLGAVEIDLELDYIVAVGGIRFRF